MSFNQPNWSEYEVIFKYTDDAECQKIIQHLEKLGFKPGLSPHFSANGEYKAIKAPKSVKQKAFIAGAKFAFDNSIKGVEYYSKGHWYSVDLILMERIKILENKSRPNL